MRPAIKAKGKGGSSWAVKLKVDHYIRESKGRAAPRPSAVLRGGDPPSIARPSNAEPALYTPQGRDEGGGQGGLSSSANDGVCCYQLRRRRFSLRCRSSVRFAKSSLRRGPSLVTRTSPLCTVCLVQAKFQPRERYDSERDYDSNGVCLMSRICSSSMMTMIIYWFKEHRRYVRSEFLRDHVL